MITPSSAGLLGETRDLEAAHLAQALRGNGCCGYHPGEPASEDYVESLEEERGILERRLRRLEHEIEELRHRSTRRGTRDGLEPDERLPDVLTDTIGFLPGRARTMWVPGQASPDA
jgi:hypothetical protein